MTSTHTELDRSHLGTLSVLAWIGDPEDGHNIPYLIAYTLGDCPHGHEAAAESARGLLEHLGLRVGDEVLDGTTHPHKFPVKILVEGDQVALTVEGEDIGLNARCTAPPEWVAAAADSDQVYFLFATRPWPQAAPGQPVDADTLKGFVGDEEVLTSSVHAVLRVQRLKK
ncbi:DUF5949 family protein [Streptomyces sp. NBC_00536]|uniref:DUF5949 family protein n=1 Tax=Streptomyces sp. NBC_00536 TaxID=2975769 RepID=UPI002E7FD332|nr:DUF5949 family protein [Streptomyces sp. NBC_00536]WUC79535.1 DUF5949 family protein [Streptomyces sp. NBC_00536]